MRRQTRVVFVEVQALIISNGWSGDGGTYPQFTHSIVRPSTCSTHLLNIFRFVGEFLWQWWLGSRSQGHCPGWVGVGGENDKKTRETRERVGKLKRFSLPNEKAIELISSPSSS